MSRYQSIKELFNESSCSHNADTEKKVTCERLSPGTMIGGCSFEGALQALLPFKNAAHLIHSPSTCPHVTHLFSNVTPYVFTTQMDTHDLIFGGEDKLSLSIAYIYTHIHPEIIFIYLTCVSSLIGEDVERIINTQQKALGIPMILINAAGFMGGVPFGARIAGVTLMQQLMGQKESLDVASYAINLIGFNIALPEMNAYKTLLESVGFHIHWIFGGAEDVEQTQMAHCAKLNVLIGAKPMVSLARKMKETWDIPWVEVSFYGRHATSDAIRSIVENFADGKLTRISEQYIAREEKRLNESLVACREVLCDKVVLLDLKGKQSWQFIPLVKELDLSIAATAIYQCTQDDIEKVFESLKGQGMVIRDPYEELEMMIEEENVAILLCDFHHYHAAAVSKIPFMEVSPLHQASFVGYTGVLNFAQELIQTLNDPFFPTVFHKAPWE
jgi:nitrogenase molybdenum-cofactor synthesis protein NifE